MRLADRFDAFLVDLDGVVWRGDEEVPGAAETVAMLRTEGKRVIFVTNNASRSPRDCAVKLMRMRIPTEPGDVVTSAHAVDRHLRRVGVGLGSRVHVCGAPGLVQVLRSRGYAPTGEVDDVEALVIGWNPKLTFEELRRAADVARRGVPFVASNRDATYPSADGLVPGTGAILAAVEAASGRRATVVGKPKPELFLHALKVAGSVPGRTLVCGDRPETDMAGARAAGLPSALVLTGVVEDPADADPAPDFVLDRISDLVRNGGGRGPGTLPGPAVEHVGSDAAAATEQPDQEQTRYEATDVREVGDAATLFGPAESGESAEDLDDEPQAQRHPGGGPHGREEEAEGQEGDDRGVRPQDGVRAEDAGYRAGRPDDRYERVGVEDDVSGGRTEPGEEVEDDETNVAEPVFDVVPEYPEEEHVEAQVEDVGVHEHGREEGSDPGTGSEEESEPRGEGRTAPGDVAGDGSVTVDRLD